MSSVTSIDMQIVNDANLRKIENFLNATVYQESLEYSSNFNTRLCLERRTRLPFLEPQTGVAQNHCQLFMAKRQRMPGFRDGQIYSYPAKRWRKHRRQYLAKVLRPLSGIATPTSAIPAPSTPIIDKPNSAASKRAAAAAAAAAAVAAATATTAVTESVSASSADIEIDMNNSSSLIGSDGSPLGGTGDNTSDSKDSQSQSQSTNNRNKEELPKEWLFYDDMDANELDTLEEPKSPADDEYDYDPRYGSKKRKRRRPSRKSQPSMPAESKRKRSTASNNAGSTATPARSRSRRKTTAKDKKYKVDPPSPSMVEPPSFASAAADYGNDDSAGSDLHGFRY